MNTIDLALCTLGMIAGTALPRVLPISILSRKNMPAYVQTWLSFVPISILSALVAPEIFLKNGTLALNIHNVFFLASIPTFLIAFLTKSLFATLSMGMISVAFLRFMGIS